MSIEGRYDNILADMFTLLQQALVRLMTNQKIDLAKFKHYFCKFTKNMVAIEQQFHDSKIKLSERLAKLQNICLCTEEPSVSSSNYKNSKSLSKGSASKLKLNVIGQQKQQQGIPTPKQHRKRSGTAGGTRSKSGTGYFSINYENGRPQTGSHHRPRDDRYGSQIDHPAMHTITTQQYFTTQHKPRQSFYDDLQKQTDKNEIISQNIIRFPRKKTISQQRRNYKINKLF